MAWWQDVLAVVSLVILAFIAFAYGYGLWRMIRYNDEAVAGGSMGNQMLGRTDEPEAPAKRV